ncbi:E3 ubiquitin-protein ligase RNFT1 isoform X1 [Coregonus clupeaformis]|uniref:E3 ubiquitin-protein ligase RNFT1 n=1 Tax=Coregonus suidteri TaxID=861788 RepID=A0AAN8RCS2_9TELE|nr:E3 ubiquitin-protein ligase RNFT1 isoform X1 [Coregonus clupeaformis]
MKLRTQYDRSDSRRTLKSRESPTVMQPNYSELVAHQAGNGFSLTIQPELLTRTPAGATGGSAIPETSDEFRVPILSSGPGEPSGGGGGGASSRRSRATSRTSSHSHSHGGGHQHSHSEPSETDPADADLESGEPSTSFSELRYLFRWVQKSLPFIIILSAKLVIQHALGLAVGVGLFTTFLYANKNIQTQVFLQDRRSSIECVWLLLFLASSTLLLYYTFLTESLYYCLIFLSPAVEPLGFWEVLWAVGVTNFMLKFFFMGFKCLILLLPSNLVTFRAQGRWYMLIEEVGQVYQALAPIPLWFRYLITYQEVDGNTGLTLGVLLALVYFILKLLGLYGQWGSFQKTVRIFLSDEHTGAAASRSQCSEAGDICPICQAEYRNPRALLCQHIFCDECIALWFNREKTCPLCRTAITDKVHKWRDGATSPYLQIY